jgi:glycosyltransferase involved in cell wall biosynthesis
VTTILHIIDELKVGGAQTHLVTILGQLIGHDGFEHHVLSLFGDGIIGDQLRSLGIEVSILDLRPEFARYRFDVAVAKIRAHILCINPEIVEAHLTWSRLLGLFAALLARVPKRYGFEQGDIYLSSPPLRLMNFASQAYIEQFVVCSHALKHWVKHTHGIRSLKITVLHNCVDTERFHPDIRPAADLPASDNASTRIAIVGSLGTGVKKRTDIAVRALAEARQGGRAIKLLVVGDGSQREALQHLSRELGIEDHVHFLGIRSDIPEVLAACDALCHAAPFEPFGIVAIEAMAMGLPVIVPNSGGIAEAVIDGVTGLLYPPLDSSALAAHMVALHVSPERRLELGHRARESAVNDFSAAVYVKRLYQLYGWEL